MSKKAVVTGSFNLVDESTNTNVTSFDLATMFGTITSILEVTNVERQISSADGVVSLDPGGISSINGFMIYIKSGTGPVTVKHDSNTNGIAVDSSLILFGTISAITIETASATAITVEYAMF